MESFLDASNFGGDYPNDGDDIQADEETKTEDVSFLTQLKGLSLQVKEELNKINGSANSPTPSTKKQNVKTKNMEVVPPVMSPLLSGALSQRQKKLNRSYVPPPQLVLSPPASPQPLSEHQSNYANYSEAARSSTQNNTRRGRRLSNVMIPPVSLDFPSLYDDYQNKPSNQHFNNSWKYLPDPQAQESFTPAFNQQNKFYGTSLHSSSTSNTTTTNTISNTTSASAPATITRNHSLYGLQKPSATSLTLPSRANRFNSSFEESVQRNGLSLPLRHTFSTIPNVNSLLESMPTEPTSLLPPVLLDKYNELITFTIKVSAKLDSIRYSIKRKQQEFYEGLCDEATYEAYLEYQQHQYELIKRTHDQHLEEFFASMRSHPISKSRII